MDRIATSWIYPFSEGVVSATSYSGGQSSIRLQGANRGHEDGADRIVGFFLRHRGDHPGRHPAEIAAAKSGPPCHPPAHLPTYHLARAAAYNDAAFDRGRPRELRGPDCRRGRPPLRKGPIMSSAWICQDDKQVKKHGANAASSYLGWFDPDGKPRPPSHRGHAEVPDRQAAERGGPVEDAGATPETTPEPSWRWRVRK
jgi:hypothetical protein